jgi:2-oxo-4-hydroxy-4-carboxy-5-ureidoimidazoline decarboxylase
MGLSMPMRHSITELNGLDAGEFVRVVGPVFEQSSWIAERAAAKRPFDGFNSMLNVLCNTAQQAPEDKKLALIRAQHDLGERVNKSAPQPSSEQTAAGLTRLTLGEAAELQRRNREYRKKFDFPFVVCAENKDKQAILEDLSQRLGYTREEEIHTAVDEICKIAGLRLRDLTKE